MPNIRSAKKRMRQSRKNAAANRAQRSALRTAIRKVRSAPDSAEAAAALKKAEQLLDRAARKGLVHRNAAARQKARLTRATRSKS